MKYALLYNESKQHFDRRKDPAFMGAWMAYIESLRAAGVFVSGAGLESPETATTVGGIQIGHINDGKAAEQFFGLGKRAVMNLALAVAGVGRAESRRWLLCGRGSSGVVASCRFKIAVNHSLLGERANQQHKTH